MCGHDWCAVRISREIVEFASGKDEDYRIAGARPAPRLNAEQQALLERRAALGAEPGRKAACHSDLSDDQAARALQESVAR